ncbi:hypothetical protein FKM82_015252 [Ascaphus truei]
MDCYRRAHRPTSSVWKFGLLLSLYLASYQDLITAYSVSTKHSLYICPKGLNVNLTCQVTGAPAENHDHTILIWHFSKNKHSNCPERKHIRNMTEKEHHAAQIIHNLQSREFHVTLQNLSQLDSGVYCCFALETINHHRVHVSHSYIELQVKTDNPDLQNCTHHRSAEDDNENTTAAALAIVACIVGILCLPLILILVYKQRQAITNRRAQELVRMDSDAHGLENPVFDDGPSGNVQVEQRPRLIFMASRQQSDTGRHLLSEPNTPLSPPGAADCFFPSLEPVPDSPDPMDV